MTPTTEMGKGKLMTIDTITNPTTPTAAQLRAALAVTIAVREAGEIPSGTLYAMLIGKVDIDGYQAILRTLTGAGLVQVMPSHLVRWVGPVLTEKL